MNTKLRVLVPSTWSNTDRGNFFEDLVAGLFRSMAYRVVQQVRCTGMEIDLLAEQNFTKDKAYIECKFLSTPFEAGIITKLLGNVLVAGEAQHAYLVSTADPGKDAKGLLEQIADRGNRFHDKLTFAYIGPEQLLQLYLQVNQIPPVSETITSTGLQDTISAATLLVTPNEACWILEQQRNGLPTSAFAIPADPKRHPTLDLQALDQLQKEYNLWAGLEILRAAPTQPLKIDRQEVVTPIPVAEKFDDYNPSRPEDFVGRKKLQREIIDFLEGVRRDETKRRVLALSGQSGFGKSSLILKLAHTLASSRTRRNRHSGRKFYLYHVDTRSATSPLFVVEAIRKGFQSAVDEGFISYPDTVSVDSIENPFDSVSIQECIAELRRRESVLVLFFDQFEEMFTKESLFGTFETFKRMAFIVESMATNVVLGFSWRIGISFSEGHPAYHLWHSLEDKRKEFKISLFSADEIQEMLQQLEEYTAERLDNVLKSHLEEQSQGYPWLLKRLCIHVFRQLKQGVSQQTLIERQMNIRVLFDEDTSNLTSHQMACLKYVAEHAPVDLLELQEHHSTDVIDSLSRQRLLIRSGYKYSVYWDIFKEYLLTGEVPSIPMTYVPQSQVPTGLAVLRYIVDNGSVAAAEIVEKFSYSTNTVFNILGDLQAFFLIKRNKDDYYSSALGFSTGDEFDQTVAEYLTARFKRHIVLTKFYELVRPGAYISQSEFEDVVSELYSALSPQSIHVYLQRLLGWMRFAGCLSLVQDGLIQRPLIPGAGNDKGRKVTRQHRLTAGEVNFFATSSYARTIELAYQLVVHQQLRREHILISENRNAAQDLVALDLAKWVRGVLEPAGVLESVVSHDEGSLKAECAELIKQASLGTLFIATLSKIRASDYALSEDEIMDRVARELQRAWHPSSLERNVRGGIRWLQDIGEYERLIGQLSIFDLLES